MKPIYLLLALCLVLASCDSLAPTGSDKTPLVAAADQVAAKPADTAYDEATGITLTCNHADVGDLLQCTATNTDRTCAIDSFEALNSEGTGVAPFRGRTSCNPEGPCEIFSVSRSSLVPPRKVGTITVTVFTIKTESCTEDAVFTLRKRGGDPNWL